MDTDLWLCPSLPTETLKWLSSLPILMQKSFWWRQCRDRYIIYNLPPPPPPYPLPPALISLVVSVDVNHHVYLLTLLHSGLHCLCRSFDSFSTQLRTETSTVVRWVVTRDTMSIYCFWCVLVISSYSLSPLNPMFLLHLLNQTPWTKWWHSTYIYI